MIIDPANDGNVRPMGRGRLAEIACLLEVTARKAGNVHRLADFDDLHYTDFLLSAMAIGDAFERAESSGVGLAVHRAIEATRQVVATNTNLGIVLLLAPLTAVPHETDLGTGLEAVLSGLTVDDAIWVYRAIRLAHPGGLGEVDTQDVASEPTVGLREIMKLAGRRDMIARQYANGYQEVLGTALPCLAGLLEEGRSLETAIVGTHLRLLAQYPDSLIARKFGVSRAEDVSRRATRVLEAGWPEGNGFGTFDQWLRRPEHRFNPGTTADLVTAALYAALRDGTIPCPFRHGFAFIK